MMFGRKEQERQLNEGELIQYPFPIRTDQKIYAYLSLPKNLSCVEVRRLEAFLKALVIDEVGE